MNITVTVNIEQLSLSTQAHEVNITIKQSLKDSEVNTGRSFYSEPFPPSFPDNQSYFSQHANDFSAPNHCNDCIGTYHRQIEEPMDWQDAFH